MTPDELQKIMDAVKEGAEKGAASQVEISVNGKIDRLTKMMEAQNHIIEEQKNALIKNTEEDRITAFKLESYITKDEQEWKEWKIKAQPSLDLGANLRGFGKVLAYLIATIGGIIGLVVAIVSIFKKYL